MTERKVTIVVGYEPAFSGPPRDVVEAGLTATVAAVLSTSRTDSPDSVRDYPLWLACTRAIEEVVGADAAEVYEERSGLLNRFLRRRVGGLFGSLRAYALQLSANADLPEWALIRWKRSDCLVAAALNEPWDLVGGPEPYHDSYTTCFCLTPSNQRLLVERLRLRVGEEGGRIDKVVDLATQRTV
jgi:hypothetical protein